MCGPGPVRHVVPALVDQDEGLADQWRVLVPKEGPGEVRVDVDLGRGALEIHLPCVRTRLLAGRPVI